MAGLQLNPVMNIITLPFAIVVSVIAATTVFRNVFIAYDNFAGDNVVVANTSGLKGSDVPHLRTGARILFKHNTSTQMHQVSTNEIPLGEYKSQSSGTGELSVNKVVDVEVGEEPVKDVNPTVRFIFC